MSSDNNNMPSVDDGSLWERMKRGNRQALDALFRRYYAELFDYAVKFACQEEIAKDSIQEIFVYLWEKRTTISSAQSVRAYLLTMLRRQVLKTLEKYQAIDFSNDHLAQDIQEQAFSPEDMVIMQEQQEAEKRAFAEALNVIPPRLREALYLKTYQGLPYKEIAEVMDVSSQVARNYVSEAYHRLRKIMKKSSMLP